MDAGCGLFPGFVSDPGSRGRASDGRDERISRSGWERRRLGEAVSLWPLKGELENGMNAELIVSRKLIDGGKTLVLSQTLKVEGEPPEPGLHRIWRRKAS